MEVLTEGTASIWYGRSAVLCTCRSAAKRRKLDECCTLIRSGIGCR